MDYYYLPSTKVETSILRIIAGKLLRDIIGNDMRWDMGQREDE